MRFIRCLSIKSKLTALSATTMIVALIICCTVFVGNDIRLIRRDKVDQLTSVAEILAQNSSAALSFGQHESATALLHSLAERPTIKAAWMLDDQRKVFAKFVRSANTVCPTVSNGKRDHRFADDRSLIVWVPIVEADDTLGMIVVQDSLDDLQANIRSVGLTTMLALMICGVIGLSLAIPLNRYLSHPILELATTAQMISQKSDFSLRAEHKSHDEIGILYEEFNGMLARIQQRDDIIRRAHDELKQSNDQLEERVRSRTALLQSANEQLKSQMQQTQQASRELRETQAELIQASRKAGMADVANSVLHNVGNVLNSLNISASIITERVREMRIARLQQCIVMILNHDGDLADFLTNDPKGKIIPNYLPNLVDHITTDQQSVLCELESLTKNVEHIKDIVRAQQSHSGTFGVIEMCHPSDLMEDALQFAMDSIRRHRVEVIREYQVSDNIEVEVEKARLLQILVNLVKNAKESVLSDPSYQRRIVLRVQTDDKYVRYHVTDTGTGIEPSKLTKVFSHGYTTKQDGHGFGLHASANFARDMGGELTATSDGLHQGATFTIKLPIRRDRCPVSPTVATLDGAQPSVDATLNGVG